MAISVNRVGHFLNTSARMCKDPLPNPPPVGEGENSTTKQVSAFSFPLLMGEGLREGEKLNVLTNHVYILVYDLKTAYTDRLTTPPNLFTDIAFKIEL
jgi:hypothetical protein